MKASTLHDYGIIQISTRKWAVINNVLNTGSTSIPWEIVKTFRDYLDAYDYYRECINRQKAASSGLCIENTNQVEM